jgi:uncharacterized protein YqgC (DUF456 family)
MEMTLLLWVVGIVFVVLGIAGLVLPALPGPPLLFVGFLFAAWAEDFVFVGIKTIVILGVLALLTYGVDLWATMFGARRFGASKRAVIGALLGLVIGFFLGFPGVVFGPFIGAMIGELLNRRDFHAAARAGLGATVGLALGAALKLALAFSMIGIFVVARFF